MLRKGVASKGLSRGTGEPTALARSISAEETCAVTALIGSEAGATAFPLVSFSASRTCQ